MPSVAVIADIHANPFALEAVIEDIHHQNPDEVIVAGDLVGRGPLGSKVVDRIIGLGWPCIRGNHEDYMLSFFRKDVPDAWLVTDEWSASRWMSSELGTEHYAYIDALKLSTVSRCLPPLRVFHGSPRSHSEGIGVWSSDDDLDGHLANIKERTLVCAHTHRPFHTERPDGSIVNVGSVGLPFNGDWRAQYAIFNRDDLHDDWTFTFRQVPYDRDAFLRAYDETGFLRHGMITAHMLKYEVLTARPHLVPFMGWAKAIGVVPDYDQIDPFFEVFEPNKPMSVFFNKIKASLAQKS